MAGATASSLIGATYLLPAGIAVTRRIPAKWIAISIAAAGIFLFVTMVWYQVLLPVSTAAFVVALAGAAALFAARLLLQIFRKGNHPPS